MDCKLIPKRKNYSIENELLSLQALVQWSRYEMHDKCILRKELGVLSELIQIIYVSQNTHKHR